MHHTQITKGFVQLIRGHYTSKESGRRYDWRLENRKQDCEGTKCAVRNVRTVEQPVARITGRRKREPAISARFHHLHVHEFRIERLRISPQPSGHLWMGSLRPSKYVRRIRTITLYFSDDNALWSLPTADIGSDRAIATKLADGLVYGLNFGVTSTGIYYMSAGPSPRQSTIRFFDFRTRNARSVLQIDKLWWFGLTVSPDERSLLYSVRDQDGTDLLVVDHVQ